MTDDTAARIIFSLMIVWAAENVLLALQGHLYTAGGWALGQLFGFGIARVWRKIKP